MYCWLCLEEPSESFIEIESKESFQCNLTSILMKYFDFCFDEAPTTGIVCHKCWNQVELFHNYYIHIETVHKANEIKVEEFSANDFEDYATLNLELDELLPKRKICKRKSITALDVFSGSSQPKMKYEKKKEKEPKSIENKESGNFEAIFESKPIAEFDAYDSSSQQKRKYTKKKEKDPEIIEKKDPENTETIFQCPTCELKFLSRVRLERHVKNDHISLQFKCPEQKCVESYDSQVELAKHVREKHTRVPCPQCDKLISPLYLMYHMKEIHDDQKRIVCDICGNISNNARKHETHYRMVHSVPEKFQCDICKSFLSSRDAIRAHMRRRHVERPVNCPICGRPCANKNSLYKHKQTHTTEYRDRYKCVVCGKGFRDKTNLRQHSVVHNGDTDCYSCSICARTFRCSRSLNAHQKRMHPLEDTAASDHILDVQI